VKQGDNLAAPILFLFDVQAAAELMNEKWRFREPDLSVSYMNKQDTDKEKSTPSGFQQVRPSMQTMLPSLFYKEKSLSKDRLSLGHS
jgi:hypothetical protein